MQKTVLSALKFGAIGGLLVLVYTSLITRSGILYAGGIGQYLGYLAIVIMPFCTYLAIKEVTRLSGREVRLGQALATGMLLSVIAGSIYSGVSWVEYTLFTNVYEERLLEETRDAMAAAGNTAAEIEQRLQHIRDFYDSWQPFLNTLTWYCGLGLLYSFGSYLLLKYFFKTKTT